MAYIKNRGVPVNLFQDFKMRAWYPVEAGTMTFHAGWYSSI